MEVCLLLICAVWAPSCVRLAAVNMWGLAQGECEQGCLGPRQLQRQPGPYYTSSRSKSTLWQYILRMGGHFHSYYPQIYSYEHLTYPLLI